MRIPTAETAKAPAKLASDKRASDDLCLVWAMEAPICIVTRFSVGLELG